MRESLLKINLGCGLSAPDGWVNVDASFSARLSKFPVIYALAAKLAGVKRISWPPNIRIMDVSKRLPFGDNSVDAFFSSHMLEHLSRERGEALLFEIFRCLKATGVVRIIVPDVLAYAREYVGSGGEGKDPEHVQRFISNLGVGGTTSLFECFGRSRHLAFYDEALLRKMFAESGFLNVKRCRFGDSAIEGIDEVETEERHNMAVCLEAVK